MDLTRRAFLAANGTALGVTLLPGDLLAAVQANTPPTPKLSDWNQVRRQFRLSPDYVHLSGFYIVSHPEPVRSAIEGFRKALDESPFLVVEQGMFESDSENLQHKVCADVAEYLGGRPEEIALTANTTTGLSLVYHGLPLKVGDEILTTTHDHFSHHETIRLATERNGASVRKIKLFDEAATASADQIVARIRGALRPQTRVLGITWVHSSSGIRLPVRQIADALKEVNGARAASDRVLLVLDGVHGIGVADEVIATMGCDFFCAGTHKWIFAPRGTGIVWATAENWARIKPLVPSFSSKEVYAAWSEGRLPRGPNTADRVSPGGFQAFEHQWAMGAAFRMHQKIGRARVAERIRSLNDQCKQGLASMAKVKQHTPRAAALSAGICCFEIEGKKPEDVVNQLLARKIIASSSPYAVSYVRLSAGLMNTPEDVDKALTAVRAVVGT